MISAKTMVRSTAGAFLVLLVLSICPQDSAAGQRPDELSAVLARASQYVAEYEDKQLGNLLAAEDYVQNSEIRISGRNSSYEKRRTQSDFLILLLGEERVGLRKVIRVDGKPVNSSGNFAEMMDGSPDSIRKQVAAVQNESSQYNLGPVLRHINVPTFALAVARAAELRRFSFEKDGTKKIDGVETWEVRFKEQRSPTLTHGLKGESLLSTGSLWIDPQTGRILRTEFTVENPFSESPVKGTVTVTYKMNNSLRMLVPVEMEERYQSRNVLVDCVATYSNFRAFNVDIQSVIGAETSR